MSRQGLSLKQIGAVVIGNAFEWYDYFVYSFLSVYLAKLFFPSANDLNSLLAVFATFGVALLMRPLGGLVLGHIADKYGRVRALNSALILMVAALALICFTPTYQQIGIIAPIVVVFSRLLQGFSAGGECGISGIILFESAPATRRGLYCSFHNFSQMIAVQLSLGAGLLLSRYLTLEQIEAWGWRIPFSIGLLLLPVGIYIRRNLNELNGEPDLRARQSLISLIKEHTRHILIVIGMVGTGTVSMYVLLSYMPTYVTVYLHLKLADVYYSTFIAVALMCLCIPFFGWLSDRVGRKSLLILSISACLIVLYPAFSWLNNEPSLERLILVQSVISLPLALYFGVIQVSITELFPVHVRSTCLSLGINCSVLLFGAFAQFFVTLCIKYFNTPIAVLIYPSAVMLIGLFATVFYTEDIYQAEYSRHSLLAEGGLVKGT